MKDAEWKLFEGRTPQDYVTLYRDQLEYIDQKVLEGIKRILSSSPHQPLIVLQSDHGPASLLEWQNPTPESLRERMSILNAYYLPGTDYSVLD